MENLIKKFEDRCAIVGVVGLGYVGIPLAISICNNGMKVIGFDVSAERIATLRDRKSPIRHISDNDIAGLNAFDVTGDFERISECDAIIICVPTPLNKFREPDLSYVVDTMKAISPFFHKGQLLCLESTTWPGTTREVLQPHIEQAGFVVGEDFFLVYSPEREDPGNNNFKTTMIPKIVGGRTEACLATGVALYQNFVETIVPVSSTEVAEMAKLLENIHRSVNIGLVNEIKILADAMGLDIFEIIDAAKTKPFGFTAYYPGPGIGGHCIPIDPFYLTWKAREFGLHTRFIELAGEINASMPQYVVRKLVESLNKSGKSLNGAKVLALGIAYKRNVDDVRESPSVLVMEILREWGADVFYSDPIVASFPTMRQHSFELNSVEITPESLSKFDAVVLLTDHDDFDYDVIQSNAKLLVDTRGKFRNNPEIIRA